jgi:hypothetical protein
MRTQTERQLDWPEGFEQTPIGEPDDDGYVIACDCWAIQREISVK